MSDYKLLDLFCGLGGFSAAFEDSGRWEVTTVDLNAEFDPDIVADVCELQPTDFDQEFDVVLASPPCNCFTIANQGHHVEAGRIKTDRARDSVTLVYHTLGLIRGLQPRYWFVENPRGHLRKFMPERPRGTVTYCQYGADYQKPTDLWGRHPSGMSYLSCPPGANCHTQVIGDEDSGAPTVAADRALVPYELSESIRDACESGLDGTAPEQTELPVIAND